MALMDKVHGVPIQSKLVRVETGLLQVGCLAELRHNVNYTSSTAV